MMKTTNILICSLMLMVLTSCDYFRDILGKEEEKSSFIADISAETDYNILAYSGEDDSYVAVRQSNGKPIEALVRTSAGADPYPVWFNSDGNVDKIVINGYILLFRNYTAVKFDVAVISPTGELTPFRDLPIPHQSYKSLRLKSGDIAGVTPGDALVMAGHAIGVASCVSSIIMAVPAAAATLGVATPASMAMIALGCGSTAIGLAAEWVGDEEISSYLNLPLKTVKAFTTTINCAIGSKLSCFAGIAGLTLSVAGGILRDHEKDIRLAEGVLQGGYGDVQVTLTWDSSADIDLYVRDPASEYIWYNHKYSASGGWLDVDDTNGYGPENIKWDYNTAPDGIYKVYVKHFAGGNANFSVLVQAFGRMKQFSGSIAPGQTISITDFSRTYLKKAELPEQNILLPVSSK